jgi:hypothetical protein
MVKVFMVLVVILFNAGVVRFTPVYSLFTSESAAAHLFDIENPNETYTLVVNSDSNAYGIYPEHKSEMGIDKDHAAYISSSPVDLDQYVNKKVKITGDFTLKRYLLKTPHNTKVSYTTKVESVNITSIHLVR